MLMTEKQVSSALDHHHNKTSADTLTINKDGTDSKNQNQLSGSSSSNSSVPYNTLSLGRKGKRGISQLGEDENNVHVALADNKECEDKNESLSSFTVDTPEYTLILPDINNYPPDFRDFLKKDLLETSTLVSLEHAGRLNWWVDLGVCRRLFPLVTTGDGNCLLHAASLALTGLHDNRLILRKALSRMMCNSPFKNSVFRRWRWHQTIMNKQSELVFTEAEWTEEWNNLAKLASTQPRVPSQPPCEATASTNNKQRPCEDCEETDEILYESLEEFHVFILAHVLKRTIIIIADTILKNLNGEPLAPISFGGIYLPLECSPSKCLKSPLLLTYDAAHFSALVPMEDNSDAPNLADAIPLVDPDFELLPIHFVYDPGPSFQWSSLEDNFDVGVHRQSEQDLFKLLQSYMDVKFLGVPYAGEFEQKPDKSEPEKDQMQKDPTDKAYDCSQSTSTVLNFSDSTGNSSRTCSSRSSPEENSVESSKSAEDCNKHRTSSASTNTDKSLSKSKKFSSFKKRIGKTLKMGFCASGIQQELDEVEENKNNSLEGSKQFSRKTKNTRDDKGSKALSPGNPKGNKNDGTVRSNVKPVAQASADVQLSADVKVNGECTRSQMTNSTSKQEIQALTQLKCPDRVLCARLYHKRDETQDRILKRYFVVAQDRFHQFKKEDRRENQNCLPTNCHLDPHQTSAGSFQHASTHLSNAGKFTTLQCINAGCLGPDASAETSYLCRECFERQKQEELDMTIKMSSNKQMQQQFNPVHVHHPTKYLTSSTPPSGSSSTVHLPLIKNPVPSNSHFSTHKHSQPFQHQLSYPQTTCYRKPPQTVQPAKSNIISSLSGAAAFNKSFESNFKEDCIISPNGTSYSASSVAGGPNVAAFNSNNKFHAANLSSSKPHRSPTKNLLNDANESLYSRPRFKYIQPIDSPLPTMYASEEEDDEERDDCAVEERNRERSFANSISHQKTNLHENSAYILSRQKFVDTLANKAYVGTKVWNSGFRSSSFDDNNCHALPAADAVAAGPWISKTSACKTEGCSFYGTANSDYFCSRCFKQKSGNNNPGAAVSLRIPANKSIVL